MTATADCSHDGRYTGTLLQDFKTGTAGAGDDLRVVERMDERESSFAFQLMGLVEEVVNGTVQ